ncbi:hypothetical protein SFC43_06430 [Bacteroides sp. CR5/BHMF/2]|nr:hypothetical protein [Bacteroides sp. CR5/BHMF/2]
MERYEASTNGMELVNHGTMEAESINGNNNTNIKNGCYLKTGKFQFGTLVMGILPKPFARSLVIMVMTMTL